MFHMKEFTRIKKGYRKYQQKFNRTVKPGNIRRRMVRRAKRMVSYSEYCKWHNKLASKTDFSNCTFYGWELWR